MGVFYLENVSFSRVFGIANLRYIKLITKSFIRGIKNSHFGVAGFCVRTEFVFGKAVSF
jgi:hypothetical protein